MKEQKKGGMLKGNSFFFENIHQTPLQEELEVKISFGYVDTAKSTPTHGRAPLFHKLLTAVFQVLCFLFVKCSVPVRPFSFLCRAETNAKRK